MYARGYYDIILFGTLQQTVTGFAENRIIFPAALKRPNILLRYCNRMMYMCSSGFTKLRKLIRFIKQCDVDDDL